MNDFFLLIWVNAMKIMLKHRVITKLLGKNTFDSFYSFFVYFKLSNWCCSWRGFENRKASSMIFLNE